MKSKCFKILVAIALCFAVAAPVASATDAEYPYFLFMLTDGSSRTLASENLVITFSEGQVVAVNDTENVKIDAASVNYACFASSQSALQTIEAEQQGQVELYSLDGVYVGAYATVSEALQSAGQGVYVLKSKTTTVKIAVQ